MEEDSWWVKSVRDHFKTQGICDRAVENGPYNLEYVPDHLKTQKMCERAVDIKPLSLADVSD